MRQWWSKTERALGRRQNLASELEQEMDAHLQFLIEANLEQGMAPEDALIAARREFGNMAIVQERSYQSWQFPRFESLLQDIRYALRGIVKAPAFSLIVILTLAVGIGANTAIFSTVYAVLLKPLPFPAGERLVWLGESNAKASGISVTWINFEHWQAENHSFEAMAGFQNADLTLAGRGQATLTHAGLVTSQFFQLTGSRPMMGRLFAASDDESQSPATVVVTQSFWAKSLSADPQIVGKMLTLDGNAYTVVGVLARDPAFFLRPVDYYLPIRPSASQAAKRDAHGSMRVLALLKPGLALAAARSDLNTIMERLAKSDPGPEVNHRAYAEFLTEERTGDVKHTLVLLMGSVGLVLILACANIGSLFLVRMTIRVREMAIRSAIGAGRGRLVRQLLTETMLISFLGGTCGVLVAALALRALERFGPRDIPRLAEASLSLPVLIFALALTMMVALVCSIVPVLCSGHVNFSVLLKESTTGSGSSGMGHAVRGGLVVTEIALAVILLFTSGILVRSLWAAETVNPGFEPRHVLALELQLPGSRYKEDASILDFYRRLETALRAVPGVEAVGSANCPPGGGDCGDWWYSVVERPAPGRDDVPVTLINIADSAYFRTMQIPMVVGRAPSDEDRASGPAVAVINQELARTWWKDARSAVGQHIKLGGPYMKGPVLEIVGVTTNVPDMGLDSAPLPQIYLPFEQRVSPGMVVAIQTRGTPESTMATVRRTLASIDSDIPIQSLKPMDDWLGSTLTERRFITALLALFALVAVILAAIGCYGVLNYWVSSRTQEIAIRMAMGARTAEILRRTATQAAKLGALGSAIGLVGSWGAARWLKSLVYGISNRDPIVLLSATVIAFMFLALAAAVPLWRSTRINLIETLHEV
jgi:putative ABC transport system permease protein